MEKPKEAEARITSREPERKEGSVMELIPLTSVHPNPNNPRVIKDDKFKKLVKSIQEFPQMLKLRPIVVDEAGMVLGGNMRLRALQSIGAKETYVVRAESLTAAQKSEFIAKDNIGFGDWDWDIIANEWDTDKLSEWGLDIPVFSGREAVEDDYQIPDEIETEIKRGDIIEIGQHKLMCGDSTSGEDVGKLLDGAKPTLMVTDPPYGVNYDANWRNEVDRANGKPYGGRAIGKVSNDNRVNWETAYKLFPGDVAYVWHGGRHAREVHQNLEDSGLEIVAQIVWVKNNIVIGRGDYHFKHEPCWYAVRKGKKHNWQGSRKEATVWEIDKPMKSETGHSTQKPVECMARPIRNNSYERESVYDPFIGSGTTMVAAHQLNRKCYGMEIEPKYCQIIIDRMSKLDENIIVKVNGKEYKTELLTAN